MQEWRLLQEFGCTVGQGWLIARPMQGADICSWLKIYRTRSSELTGRHTTNTAAAPAPGLQPISKHH